MDIDDINYDIDNIDLEKQMLMQDLEEEFQEEQDIQDLEDEKEEKKQQLENEKSYFESRRLLNAKNLGIDLDIPVEELRPKYRWHSDKDDQLYEGCVVHKFDKDNFIFSCSVVGNNEFKLKKFNLNNIQQIKK